MGTSYPGSLDSWSNPTSTTTMDDASFQHDVLHANHNDAIEAIEAELGTDPAGGAATVKARLDVAAMAQSEWRGWPSGTYISSARSSTNQTSTISASADTVRFVPWLAPLSVTLDRFVVEVTTLQASANARLGIYSTASTGIPDSLIADFGEIDCSTTGLKELTISQSVTAGVHYWFALLNETNSVGYRGLGQADMQPLWMATAMSASNTTLLQAVTYSNGLPSSVGTLTVGQVQQHMFWLRRS